MNDKDFFFSFMIAKSKIDVHNVHRTQTRQQIINSASLIILTELKETTTVILVNFKINFAYFFSELPEYPKITNMKGQEVSSSTPTFHLGTNLTLICTSTGGKYTSKKLNEKSRLINAANFPARQGTLAQ